MAIAKRKKRKVGKSKPSRATTYTHRGRATSSRGRVKTRKRKSGVRSRR